MVHSIRTLVLASALALGAPLALSPMAQADSASHHTPKVSLTQARRTALHRIPGKVVAEELEKEHGLWIYSFEIRPTGEKGKLVKEVNVNADTGAIVNVETEHEG